MPDPVFSGPALDDQVQQLLAQSWQTTPSTGELADRRAGPVQAPAETKSGIGPWPYVAAAAGQALDGGSTLYNFGRGYTESNGVYGGGQPSGKVLATKAGISAATMLLMKALAKKNPSAAKALGYSVGAAGAIPAAINFAQPDLKK